MAGVTREDLAAVDPEILLADGFDEAIIGWTNVHKVPTPVAVYSVEKCLDVLASRNGWDYSKAVEYFNFNVVGAYMGKQTPIFVYTDVG